jgi:MoxR-like ATPase
MPADIVGSEILDGDAQGQRRFRFVPGPVFASLVMGDEVNRASPRTQSALLQAMQERHVTVAGQRYDLPEPFHVLATQNPIEQEGTYPLPEAQLDRFLLQIDVPYPDAATERSILLATTGGTARTTNTVASTVELQRFQAFVRTMPVGEKVLDTIIALVRSARPDESAIKAVRDSVSWGPGPRAGQALVLACKARALLRGRLAPSLDDVMALARPALAHRMALNWSARADGLEAGALIETLVQNAIAP